MIAGKTLIQRVVERAAGIGRASAVWVATDDDRILQHVESFGGRVVRTSGEFTSGTDRIAGALPEIERNEGRQADQIINLQGDEPLIDTSSVDRMIESLEKKESDIATLASR